MAPLQEETADKMFPVRFGCPFRQNDFADRLKYVPVEVMKEAFDPEFHTMNPTSWKKPRKTVGMPHGRIHDLRHTFGRRLRAAGVSLEDREDLLGHKSARMTTHYSQAELASLIEAADKVCGKESRKSPALVMLR